MRKSLTKQAAAFVAAEKMIKSLGGEGILEPSNIPDLATQRGKVLKYMAKGQWRFGPDIVAVAGGSEGLRRLRELRKLPGIKIERRYAIDPLFPKKRVFQYRLVRRFMG